VIGAVARKETPDGRDEDEGSSKRAASAPVVDLGGLAVGPVPAPTTHLPMRDSSVDAQGASASARGEPQRWPGTNREQGSASHAAGTDPSLVVPVIASQEDVLRARQLRDQIRKEYLNRPGQPCSLWCVGAD
jgi:hypothetical protein